MGVRGSDAQSISSVVFRLRYPLYLVCSFRGRNVLKEGGIVRPCPKRVYGMCNRRVAYVHQGLP